MKKWHSVIILLTLLGCSRSANQVWEDTKTAGSHLKKSFRSLWGSKGLSEQYASNADFFPNFEEEFVPLEETPISTAEPPQSKLEPGESKTGIPAIDGFVQPTGSLSSIFQLINFELNDFKIQNIYNTKLDAIADYLKKHKNVYLFIEGHCCEKGSAQYNLALGIKRAAGVRAYLIKRGVSLDRIFTISYGLERPIDTAQNESAYRKNRRVEFKIFEK